MLRFFERGDFMEYQKPPKGNLKQHLKQNILDSHNGLRIMLRESSTVHRIYPMMIIGWIILGIAFKFIVLEHLILAALFILDFVTETVNSAIEEACDSVEENRKNYNEYVKRSKDIASAAVYITHLCFIATIVFFAVSQAAGFEWWTKLIPA
jgi:diacylglycerol kinase